MSLHIGARVGEVADKVLLPGDPLRAKYIAERFLDGASCYTEVRGMYGFTGTYKSKRVSVQGTGMGIPSIGIYIHELMAEYGVQTLIRVGTCGTFAPRLKLRDLLIASGSTHDSAVNQNRFGNLSFSCIPDWRLLEAAVGKAREMGMSFQVGQVLTMDQFYDEDTDNKIAKVLPYGVLACDMESSELYTQAAGMGRRALSVMTVSDSLIDGSQVPAIERQTKFDDMIRLALEII
ncbi:MAG: purine-nucleoside phosphorylase [Sphaerochaetaceae bacterium]|nr:purine-nucleoside phosphorylase [Spirochaetales bacterium]MDY5500086.1 purine-nucleoside phosphorylase [Sphaerochaetaceae bacterium]